MSGLQCAGVVVCRDSGTVLALQHVSRGLCFPCGKLMEGETPLDAAIREVHEETPYVIDVVPAVSWAGIDTDANFVTMFRGRLIGAKRLTSFDHREGRPVWVQPAEMINLMYRYSEYNRVVLKHFQLL